jgi:hypothetical protein
LRSTALQVYLRGLKNKGPLVWGHSNFLRIENASRFYRRSFSQTKNWSEKEFWLDFGDKAQQR